MKDRSEFVIQDGVLVRYRGTGGIVKVPDGVIGIFSGVFERKKVVEVKLPNSLQWLADGTFRSCARLRRLRLPGSLRVVPDSLCSGCRNLTDLVLEEGIQYLSWDAFDGCGFSSLTIPDSVWVIGNSCFSSCRQLRELSLGEGLQRIGGHAFENCSQLLNVSFPDSLRKIGEKAFCGCSALQSVHLSTGLEVLDQLAFQNCASLREASLPESLEVIGRATFDGCDSLERLDFQGPRAAFRGHSPNQLLPPSLVIRAPYMLPDWLPEWLPLPFRSAALAGFQRMKEEGCSLPRAIREAWEAYDPGASPASPDVSPSEPFHIVDGVLCGVACPEGQVVVPEGVIGIRAEVFQKTNVREVLLPDSVTWIQFGAFRNCTQLESVRLPNGLTHIPDELFRNCLALRSVQIPEGVRHIEGKAFMNSGLESLVLPNSLETIGPDAFEHCLRLQEVRIPEGVYDIQSGAFYRCRSLRQVALPDSLDHLGGDMFGECEALEKVDIGKGLTNLESYIFQGCTRLRGLDLPAIRTLYPGGFPEPEEGFLLRLEAPVFDIERVEMDLPDYEEEDDDDFDTWNQVRTLRIIAPNADPSVVGNIHMLGLLRGFSIAEGEKYRFEKRYLDLLNNFKRTWWDEPDILRGLMRRNMLKFKDMEHCMSIVQGSGKPELVAELLDYWHRRFPQPVSVTLQLPPLDLES